MASDGESIGLLRYLVAGLATVALGVAGWLSRTVGNHGERLAALESSATSHEKRNDEMRAELRDINAKLDRLIERGA